MSLSDLEGDYIWSKEYLYAMDPSQMDAEGKQVGDGRGDASIWLRPRPQGVEGEI